MRAKGCHGRWIDSGFDEEIRGSILNIATMSYVLEYTCACMITVQLVYGCLGGL